MTELLRKFIRNVSVGEREGEWESPRYSRTLLIPNVTKRRVAALKALNSRMIINDERVQTLDVRAKKVLGDLFTAFSDSNALGLYPDDFREGFKDAGPNQRARISCDYIAGMTDQYAERMWQRLFTGTRVALHDY